MRLCSGATARASAGARHQPAARPARTSATYTPAAHTATHGPDAGAFAGPRERLAPRARVSAGPRAPRARPPAPSRARVRPLPPTPRVAHSRASSGPASPPARRRVPHAVAPTPPPPPPAGRALSDAADLTGSDLLLTTVSPGSSHSPAGLWGCAHPVQMRADRVRPLGSPNGTRAAGGRSRSGTPRGPRGDARSGARGAEGGWLPGGSRG